MAKRLPKGIMARLDRLIMNVAQERDNCSISDTWHWWDGFYHGMNTAREAVRQCRRKAKPKPKK